MSALAGSRKNLPARFLASIQHAMIRQGEYSIAVTRDALAFLGVDIQSTWDVIAKEFCVVATAQIDPTTAQICPVAAEEPHLSILELDRKCKLDRLSS